MGFKLGTARQNEMTGGDLRTRLRFGAEAGGDASVPGTPVIRKSLAPGIMGEANNDGSIFISDEIQPGSALETEVLLHEMRHATDLKTGKLAYADDYVKYNGVTYLRENRNGKDMIKVDGKWKEAGDDFPWENDANNKKNGDI
tara:strand:+ start:380 stop:808 length:429 start_codon:yes stop_codon:yes gene_type:complete